jgi:hypothetical protein
VGALARFFRGGEALARELSAFPLAMARLDRVVDGGGEFAAESVTLVVARRTCIKSFFSFSSLAGPESRLPAQLTRRTPRLTLGVILFCRSLVKVLNWSSGMSFAGGVDGIDPAELGGDKADLV